MMMGSFGLTGVSTPLKSFVSAKESGARVMEVIDRKSKINIEDPSGLSLSSKGRSSLEMYSSAILLNLTSRFSKEST